MSRKYRLYQVDSFTDQKFSGNPAGVVPNADGLTDMEMQKIARELNNSETAFIFSSDSDDYDVHLRFFTPTKEVPICGHATIAAHYIRAVENKLDNTRVIHKTGAGILPVDIIREENDYRIIMTQGKIEFGELISGKNKETLISALSLTEKDLLEYCPVQIVSTGHSKVMVGIKDSETLNNLRTNYDSLSRLSELIGCNGYYVFTINKDDSDVLVNGRMFAPAIGINEDPVTGNANGPLGAYLVHYKLVEHDVDSLIFNARQGEAIGRAGTIGVEVAIKNGEPSKVRISGKAVTVFSTELTV
jgi:phenazine biosynthesis protein PhzF family